MNNLVIASHNKGKIKEFQMLLKSFKINLLSLDDVGITEVIEEGGSTFHENAIKKAEGIMRLTKCLTLADDSGLSVEALNGLPGVYSARFAGQDATDEMNIMKLLDMMKNVPDGKRNASFICCIAIARPGYPVLTYEGSYDGYISFSRQGINGFGYDSIFMMPEYQKTFAELPPSIKDKISHRAKAIDQLKKDFSCFI